MGCSVSKQKISNRTKSTLEAKPQQEMLGDLTEYCQEHQEPINNVSNKVQINQVIPSSGETKEQPEPSSPGCQNMNTQALRSPSGPQISSQLKSALVRPVKFPPVNNPYKRNMTVQFVLSNLTQSKKPNYRLRKKFNVDDLFH